MSSTQVELVGNYVNNNFEKRWIRSRYKLANKIVKGFYITLFTLNAINIIGKNYVYENKIIILKSIVKLSLLFALLSILKFKKILIWSFFF